MPSVAGAEAKDKGPEQRVKTLDTEQYVQRLTFDENDRPHAKAVEAESQVLDRRGKVLSRAPLPKATPGRPGVRKAAEGEGYTCVSNRKRKGLTAFKPYPWTRESDKSYIRFVWHTYRQRGARDISTGTKNYTSKQFEVCAVGGAHSKGGNRLSRVRVSTTMRSGDRLIGFKWAKGKEVGTAKANLSFAVPVKPATITGTVDVHATYTLTGSQGPDKHGPDSWKGLTYNQVNGLWEGSSTFRWQGSTHFQGNVSHALYEMPQKMRTPPIEFSMGLSQFCGHPFGIGCA